MAIASHGLGEERASVPRIVLPITRDGLLVTDRLCWGILAVAMAASAALILYLNRGTTFFLDELALVYGSPGFDADWVLSPINGHLGAIGKLYFKAILETFGTDYAVFRALAVAMIVVTAGLLYTLIKRRIGALPALAPAFVLLFFGSAGTHVVIPIGLGIFVCMAAGLAALLALERDDLRGDIGACVLVLLSVATFTIGLAFLLGVAVSVLIRPDRLRRAWIFAVPLALYAVWFLWSLGQYGSAEGQTMPSNALLIPAWIAESLAVNAAALVGLNYDFGTGSIGWGRVVAAVAAVALALRIRRDGMPASLWVSLAILLGYWSLGALAAGEDRGPQSTRYIVPGSVFLLLVAADAARSVRFSRLGLAVLFGACAVSLATNIALLRDGAASMRNSYSTAARAQFAALDLARGHVDPDFRPIDAAPDFSPVGAVPETYYRVADRYGSLGYSPAELERQSEEVREGADRILAGALDLRLEPTSGARGEGCRRLRADAPGASIEFELPAGGATIRAGDTGPAAVSVRRFAGAPAAEVGDLAPGETARLGIPPDSSTKPWVASVTGARSIEACRLPGAGQS